MDVLEFTLWARGSLALFRRSGYGSGWGLCFFLGASIAAFPWTWLDPMFYFHGQLLVPKPIMLYPTRYSTGFPRLGFAMGR